MRRKLLPLFLALNFLACLSFGQISDDQKAALLEELCFRFFISSQPDSVASYQSELESVLNNSDNSRLIGLSEFYRTQASFSSDSIEFFRLSSIALTKARETKCNECVALHFLENGLAYRKWQRFSLAVDNLKKGIIAMEGLKGRRSDEVMGALNAALSNTYHQLGEFSVALKYGLDALRIAESLNDITLANRVYTPLSTIYADLSSPNNQLGTEDDRARYKGLARKYMLKSYESSITLNNQRASGTSAYNLGIYYNDENKLDSSSFFLRKAIAHGVSSDYPELLSSAYNIMAINYSETKIDSALIFADNSIAYARKGKLVRHQATAMLSKANLLQMSGKSRDALRQAEEALKLCLQSERKVSILNAYKILSELNEETGNPAKAYEYYKKHIAIKDSLVSEENYSRIEELKMQYDVELKDKEIGSLSQQTAIQTLELRQRNVMLISLAIFVALAGIAIALFVRQRTLRQKQVIMEVEQRLNRVRMNPHLFFNTLTSLQQHALKSNDGLALASRLSQFSQVMRKTLESTYQEYITIEDEINFLRQYLEVQRDHSESFDFSLETSASLEASEMLIPPMIIQPFVENSIEHGLTGLDRKGHISIRFEETADELYIAISDNGKGLENSKPGKNAHISRAMEIIKDRIYLLRARMRSNARFNVGPNPAGQGVLVAIYLPKVFVSKTTIVQN